MEPSLLAELGVAGTIVAAVVVLLRQVNALHINKKEQGPPTNGRVDKLRDATQAQFDLLDGKIQDLTREQSETRVLVERLAAKLDTILDIVRR